MKNIIFLLFSFLIVFMVSSCSDSDDDKQSEELPTVTIKNINAEGYLSIEQGSQVQLELDVSPAGVLDDLVFEGEYSDVFSVDNKGLVTAMADGSGLLTIKYGRDLSILSACKVDVYSVFKPIESITFPEAKDDVIEIEPKAITKIILGILPANASNKNFSYESSDINIFEVDKNGLIIPISPGVANLTVRALDGSGVVGECQITVSKRLVTEIIKTNMSVLVGQELALPGLITIYPENATDTQVSYLSNDPAIATVDENGILKAHSAGKVDIKVKAVDGSEVETTIKIAVGQAYQSLDRSDYAVTCSDEKVSDGGGCYMILNDDDSKYWHSEWSPNAPLPHWLLVDMKEIKTLSRIMISRRSGGHTTDTKLVRIEGSTNGGRYQTLGVIDFGNGSNQDVSRAINFYPTEIRYVKITIEESNRAPFANLAVFKPYILE